MKNKIKVLVAGVGGASLGTEILKCLSITEKYTIYSCDISPFAFGHFDSSVYKTYVITPGSYIENIVDICKEEGISFVIPGGEEPMALLNQSRDILMKSGVVLVANSKGVIDTFSDKHKTFGLLSDIGIKIPFTRHVDKFTDLSDFKFPCIVKPSIGTGGSAFVFIAENSVEATMYVEFLMKNGKEVILQEYIDDSEGEFTVGVLSLPNKQILGSIAIKRLFHSKLSIITKSSIGTISSGYTQGLIDLFPDICAVAERIAKAINSEGPINIQGRVKDGILIPFEINPRFSASTYLRTMAGFNEIDIFLNYLASGEILQPKEIKSGYALRSFDQILVDKEGVKFD